jgi:hypothetical protein
VLVDSRLSRGGVRHHLAPPSPLGISPSTLRWTVRIVRLDYGFWYGIAEADDRLEPGESPHLNAEGHLYYVRFRSGWTPGDGYFRPDSPGHPTLDEAIAYAEPKPAG